MADIELPQLGESVTEGTITQWFKAVGDEVAEDEPLFEVSTDKVDSEVPSPSSGYLAEILVEEGDTVDVGTKVAVLSDGPPDGAEDEGGEEAAASEPSAEGGDASADKLEDAGEAAQSAAEPEATADPDASEPSDASDDEGGEGGGDEPEAAKAAAEGEAVQAPKNEDPTKGAASPKDAPADGSTDSGGGGDAPVLSPVVRRLLDEAGVDASAVAGTGIGGRITRADAENHIRQAAPSGQPATSAAPATPAAPTSAPTSAPAPTRPQPSVSVPSSPATELRVAAGSDETVSLNKIRRITAEHMTRSLDTSAHAYVSTEVDYQAVERVRTAHRERFKAEEGTSLTYLPFVARALVDALADFPHVNASMGEADGELVVHGSAHLGFAVDLDHEGLIVPVVHDAQDQRLRAIARKVSDLAGRARSKGLSADDITGGTVTITNVGSTGNTFLLPIINQPQVMILSTEGVHRRPVVVTDDRGNESIAIHSVGGLTLGWDHRAFDGAYAAQFLARIREILQTRDWEAEL